MTVPQLIEKGLKVPRKVKSVAVIGAGPAGAISLDALLKENSFDKVKVFERNPKIGGVWSIEKDPVKIDIAPGTTIHDLDPVLGDIPNFDDDDIGKIVKTPRSNQYRFVESAGYAGLRTNVPEQLMCFSDEKDWGVDIKQRIDQHYVKVDAVRDYVERYFNRHPKDHIVFRTSLENVSKDYSKPDSKFVLTLRRETDEKDSDGNLIDEWFQEEFDALVIATGHYHVPVIPKVKGLELIHGKYPEKIVHSKYFKPNVDTYDDEVVIVVGGRISGMDIVTALSKTSKTVYHSKKTIPEVKQRNQGFENIIEKPIIKEIKLNDEGKILVYFGDGSIVENPDRFIYATGYHLSFPFMNNSYPNFTNGTILPDFFEHTIYSKDPLISIVGIPIQAITFRVFEFQAIWVARFLAGKIQLPSLEEQNRWILARYQSFKNTPAYHSFQEEKFEWPNYITKIAGGVEPLNGVGKKFPIYTQNDKDVHAEVIKKYAEEHHFFLDPTKQYF